MSALLLAGNIPDTDPAGACIFPGVLGGLGFSPGNHITSCCEGLHSVELIISQACFISLIAWSVLVLQACEGRNHIIISLDLNASCPWGRKAGAQFPEGS